MIGDFQYKVLSAIVLNNREAYGLTIRKTIEKEDGKPPNYGAVYATLSRLEEAELISSEVKAPEAKRGGRRKKVFRITGAGERALNEKRQALLNMASGNWGGVYG